ncbi:unnamed protein product [Cylicocyclus nassatus]|uniref:Uncharacterized protein n=1 Tax=Cylicocyclus nassatus TaxID=53992 RepID=A0AA36H3X6_CYLNA|nr:unnamed protein product [Cylicocyclus nassatus]
MTAASTGSSQPSTAGSYSVREIIDRYESEEDDFLRELEEMRASLQNSEQEEEAVPQDPAPILSVLCSLVDEIGSLRTENRRLKTRLAPPPRSKNVVQRVSAIFDSRTNIFPRLRRSGHAEIRTGARDRLTTPPRKDPLTASSISTDFSQGSSGTRAPPLVKPELSDSEADEHYPKVERRNRRTAARRCDMSMSECTSPSSASSSRDASEGMTSSRSSFLELIGFRKRNVAVSATSLLPAATKPILKKRHRRVSEDEANAMYSNIDNSSHRQRQAAKPPRPMSYYPVEDSDDSDNLRTKRKATSFLNVHNNYDHPESLLRVDRETRLRHEKESLEAEIEELKMRNQRLVEQLREKSVQFSKLQFHTQKLDEQIDALSQRCAMNAALDKLTLDERLVRGPLTALEKIEQRLRKFQSQVQSIKLDAANIQQKTLNGLAQERSAHQACLERLENLQRENFALMQSRYLESGCDDAVWQRKIDALPLYETLYSFTQNTVRKYSDLKWALIDREREAIRAELDLIAAQSSLLVTHAQNERLRIRLGEARPKRPASFHGEDLTNRMAKREMNFFLPFKLQGSRIENSRRILTKKTVDCEKDLESEFLTMFANGRNAAHSNAQEKPYATSRIEHMMREMSFNNKSRKMPPPAYIREKPRNSSSRPMSLIEVEEQRRLKRFEETRRSIKIRKQPSAESYSKRPIDTGQFPTSSLQELPFQSPNSTPVMIRKFAEKPPQHRAYDQLPDMQRVERLRRLERGYSMDNHDRPTYAEDVRKQIDERRKEDVRGAAAETERRTSKIQRSQPVHLTRIRPPSQLAQRKVKTLESPRMDCRPQERHPVMDILDPPKPNSSPPPCPPTSRLPKPDKKSWLDKIRNMKRN